MLWCKGNKVIEIRLNVRGKLLMATKQNASLTCYPRLSLERFISFKVNKIQLQVMLC